MSQQEIYSPQKIEQYKKILDDFEMKEKGVSIYPTCISPSCITNQQGGFGGVQPPPPHFYVESGFYKCESCDSLNGKALGYYDLEEYDRFYYRRKSVY